VQGAAPCRGESRKSLKTMPLAWSGLSSDTG